MTVYLSLGSNLGDRLENLAQALRLLNKGGCRVVKSSSVYETAPLYYLKQPAFFNQAAVCETPLPPEDLLVLIAGVEKTLKRRRLLKNGPRTIDIDILFYGGRVIKSPGLAVPHPRLAEREFVLAPLAEIAPGLRHPVTGLSAAKMLSNLKRRGAARRLPSTYKEAEAWLKTLPPPAADAHYSLAPIKTALAALGSPQTSMGTVLHITGSTGKTSSACLAAAALAACGHRTGLYTSPHITGPRERIKLDGAEISEKDFLGCFLKAESCCAGELSYFELLTAMAFLYFSGRRTLFSVVEAGLGGRLDATNAADAAVAGITSVSVEHAALLGPGLKEIAAHKAGIIKKGSSALVGLRVPPEAMAVISRRAAAMKAGVSRPSGFTAYLGPVAVKGGRFQAKNAAFALSAAALAAKRAGAVFSLEKAAAALPAAIPPGRFERLRYRGRQFVLDGAHNPEGVDALLEELGRRGKKPFFVISLMDDKALRLLVSKFSAAAGGILFTRSTSYRAAPPEKLKKLLPASFSGRAEVIADPAKALARALKLAPASSEVVVAGSLYLAGDIKALLKGRKAFHPKEMLVK
ncbi:MAG: 2-amino-4-hydroxy-6-hydroxymethyldihydropteridine diphosphokinase [Elusimicrobia bacterium GWA2_61_42]|nr:MAG: 2-amino-4-hydroxy-6-hydroxymethyldihydropteridine diphosphokinase [Elusimicrobia bacterium GWA2_61_42]OGR75113.1 MAG: 2-amino-4-hydroxy-6-hydroxymethyldihydropteridine diphosphokinase [Elusimicrobia bacterium GWC2_61_25]